MYDYLIVGAGLYGAVFAHELTKKGKKCLVIDRRHHIAGNIGRLLNVLGRAVGHGVQHHLLGGTAAHGHSDLSHQFVDVDTVYHSCIFKAFSLSRWTSKAMHTDA